MPHNGQHTTDTEVDTQTTTEAGKASSATILQNLQDRLLGEDGIVSSEPSAAEQLIGESIRGLEEGQEAREVGTRARFERQRIEVGEQFQRGTTRLTEARRGFGTQTGLVRQIEEDVEKSLRDLDLREQEALATGQIEVAQSIANLKLQQLQFSQQAKQQAFSNLIQLSGLALQMEAGEREAEQFEKGFGLQERGLTLQERAQTTAEEAQAFAENQAMSNIALEFGVEIKEGDTLDSVINRAAPLASEERKAELAKLKAETDRAKAEIERAKAETAKVIAGQKSDALDDATIDMIASAAIDTPEVLGSIKNTTQLAKVINRMAKISSTPLSDEEIQASITRDAASDVPFTEVMGAIALNPRIPIDKKEEAEKIAREIYKKPVEERTDGIIPKVIEGTPGFITGIEEFIFGKGKGPISGGKELFENIGKNK